MARQRKPHKDRTSFVIAVALHAVLIGGVVFWAYKTGKLEQMRQAVLQYVKGEKKEEKKSEPVQRKQQAAPPKLPPINQGMKAAESSGTRRAVASDAPASAGGESFFQDTRKQAEGASSGGAGARLRQTNMLAVRPAAPPPPKAAFAPPPTTIKALMLERARASALVESFGTEQISKSTVSDAGDIIGKISGSTVVGGKFAVIRGLADRYTSTTFNGIDFPSADPDRRAAQLDLIPAQFISRVDVNKTFAPDMPGGFVGGAIDIVTRSFPEKFLFTASVGTAYNTQASLRNDFPVSDQSSTDWLAMDDGKRSLPSAAKATNPSGSSPLSKSINSSFHSQQFSPLPQDSPLDRSFSMTVGDTLFFLGRRFGYLAGLNYKNEYQFYDNGFVRRYEVRESGPETVKDKTDVRGVIEYTWSAMATLSYEIADHSELGFNFMYVQTAEDEARRLQGQDMDGLGTRPGESYVDQSILHWTERSLTYTQLKGKHDLPELRDARLDWAAALSTATQDEPDYRIFQFFAQPGTSFLPDSATKPQRPTRFWRNLQEDNSSFRTDLLLPLPSYNEKENNFKTGFWMSQSERAYDSRIFEVRAAPNHPFITTGDPQSYLAPSNSAFITYNNFPANFIYTGEQNIYAWYLMGDWAALDWLRFVGGVRNESTDIHVKTINLTKSSETFSSSINQVDLLPALNATLSLRENLLLRAGYSQTIVRPTYREISSAELYDVGNSRTYKGNPNLKLASSENYDLRLEWYPRPGELISLSLFNKKIQSPIELSSKDNANELVIYDNYEKADVRGVEFEFRMGLDVIAHALNECSVGFNAAYIKSEVPLTTVQRDNRAAFGDTTKTRPLYDQPEYIINADFSWERKSWGTSLDISAGIVGRRLVLVGLATPDEFEQPAPQLDVTVSQRLGRHWRLKFSAKNLLDPAYETVQTYPHTEALVLRSYTKGMTFGLSLACEF